MRMRSNLLLRTYLVVDYLLEMTRQVGDIVNASYDHVSNHQRSLLGEQIDELNGVNLDLNKYLDSAMNIFKDFENQKMVDGNANMEEFIKSIRVSQKEADQTYQE